MGSSSSPSTLRADAPHFHPESTIAQEPAIPPFIPLYGTMHGAAYAYHQDCATTGLPLPTAVQQASMAPQFPMHQMVGSPEDLEISSPELRAELEERYHSVAASHTDAMMLCRCDGISRWVPFDTREEDHECENTINVAGAHHYLGDMPSQQNVDWASVLQKNSKALEKQASERAAEEQQSNVAGSEAEDVLSNDIASWDHGAELGSANNHSNLARRSQAPSPEAMERGEQSVRNLWVSASYEPGREADGAVMQEPSEIPHHGKVVNSPRLQRGRSM